MKGFTRCVVLGKLTLVMHYNEYFYACLLQPVTIVNEWFKQVYFTIAFLSYCLHTIEIYSQGWNVILTADLFDFGKFSRAGPILHLSSIPFSITYELTQTTNPCNLVPSTLRDYSSPRLSFPTSFNWKCYSRNLGPETIHWGNHWNIHMQLH